MRLFLAVPLVATLLAVAACGRDNQDRLDDNQLAQARDGGEVAPRADNRCTAAASHEAVKRELFRRAAEIRGSNTENYARIAGFVLLVVDRAAPTAPVTPADAVECRGRATLRLPPNLSVAGGRTSLAGDIGYSVGRAAPGSAPVVTLTDDQSITIPLATLTQRRAAAPPPPPLASAPRQADPLAPEPAAPAPAPAPSAQPSFDCDRARAQSEYAVCASPTLAGLDRAMASRYRGALASADRDQARLLGETRDRFLAFRNACRTDDCIAQTYRGRMREIDDIMAGRWQAPR